MPPSTAQNALDRAFEEENLLLLYQPIHDARSGAIVAAEALVRQRREDGEIREASIITEAAEDGPLRDLHAFDSLMMKMAYGAAARWHQHAPHVRLNVNLSPREFQEGNVLPRLTELITGCGVDVHKINLEITETSYIEEPEQTMEILQELKKLGIQLWLDDFGTGHSSLTHLQHFPLDGLKVPKEFVSGAPHDHRCRSITRAVIALAHELGLKVIAEGVEKDDELAFIRELNCEYIQGFRFSRPMTLDAFMACLAGE